MRLLVPALASWAVVAALLGSPLPVILAVGGVAVLLSGGLAGLLWSRRARRGGAPREAALRVATLTGVCLVLSTGALAGQIAVREAGPLRELGQERATVRLEGVVSTDPRVVRALRGRPESDPPVVVTLDVDSVTGRGLQSSVRSRVLVMGDRRWLDVRWQERVAVSGRLAPPQDPGDDVVAVLDPRSSPEQLAEPGLVARVAQVVRERFRAATEGLPADAAGLLPGLVIGDTSRTPADLEEAMRATGMTHLSAVSGSNVAIVLAAGLGLCRLVGLRRRWRPLVALVTLVLFVVLARPEPSVVRAAAMGAVGLLGMSVSRRRAGIPALAAAVLVLLCWDPWLARSFGFALSTLATLGLLLFAGPWGGVAARFLPSRLKHFGPALAIPVAAQVMCAPVVVLLQGSVSVVGVAANLLAAPLVAPATVLGVATALLSTAWLTGAAWLAWLAAVPTLGIAWVARTCAELPYGSIPWPQGGAGAVLLAGITLAGLLAGPWLIHHSRRRPVVVVALGVLTTAVAAPTRTVTWLPSGWQFVACDVGQGDALVLPTGSGRAVVVDAGPDPDLVDGCLRRLGVEVVDTVVLTHFHADHVDGLPGVLRGREVREVLTTPVREPDAQWREVREWTASSGVPLAELYAGDDLSWNGIRAHVWWPERVIRAGSVPNNASVVMTVEVAGAEPLRLALLGDVEREAAHQVAFDLATAGVPPVDVVKVAHHGSSNRDDALLRELAAPVAVISVGADNDYGHPAPSTLAELGADGARVVRTDQSGDIAVARSADGPVLVATARGP